MSDSAEAPPAQAANPAAEEEVVGQFSVSSIKSFLYYIGFL